MNLRRIGLTAIVGLSAAAVGAACGSGGPDFVADAGSGDGSRTSASSSSSSGGSSTSSSGSTSTSSSGGSGSGGPTDAAVSNDATTSCVTRSIVLATVPPGGGSACSFTFSEPYEAGKINLVLTPGWGTVCHAGSSSNCGSGASEDGWWFVSADQIALCDRTCERFYEQTIAGKLTVQLGCKTESCMH